MAHGDEELSRPAHEAPRGLDDDRDAAGDVAAAEQDDAAHGRILRMFAVTPGARKMLSVLAILLIGGASGSWWTMLRMPGRSYEGPLPPLTERQRELAGELRRDVAVLAGEIGERNVTRHGELQAAAAYLRRELEAAGYDVAEQSFQADARTCVNLSAEISGAARSGEIVIVGAHYDSVWDCPGANDNGTGVAATLALARALKQAKPARTLRFVLFTNEEPPYFQTPLMGSVVYAKGCRERRENIVAMLSLETIGYYSDAPGSQHYPPPFGMLYPSTGNFIAFVGNLGSRKLVRRAVGEFRRRASFPSEGGAVPSFIPGVGWSDHWSFWQEGYLALMVTDTAPFRYPHYHQRTDTPDRIDYDRTARVVDGVRAVVEDLAND